jgi:hypothetical protein
MSNAGGMRYEPRPVGVAEGADRMAGSFRTGRTRMKYILFPEYADVMRDFYAPLVLSQFAASHEGRKKWLS